MAKKWHPVRRRGEGVNKGLYSPFYIALPKIPHAKDFNSKRNPIDVREADQVRLRSIRMLSVDSVCLRDGRRSVFPPLLRALFRDLPAKFPYLRVFSLYIEAVFRGR